MSKKNIITGVSGLLIGVVLTMVVMFLSAPSMMLKEDVSKYDFERTAMELRKAIDDHGWKLPTVHDLKETMENFGKTGIKNAKVFEICHPDHAYKILSRDDERIVSSLMPCRISIYEKSDGKVYVSRMNTSLMGSMMKGVVPEVMKDASAESEAIINSIIR